MPNATSIQLLLRLPMKKDSLLELREVYHATVSSNTKYPMTKEKRMMGDILLVSVYKKVFHKATKHKKTITKISLEAFRKDTILKKTIVTFVSLRENNNNEF
jgi:hypothetical protein